MEVDPGLVPGSVFKTVGLHGNHVAGGFDSHALPPFSNVGPVPTGQSNKRLVESDSTFIGRDPGGRDPGGRGSCRAVHAKRSWQNHP